jgi:hypothetical protein
MSEIVLGGTPVTRYPDPLIRRVPSADGLYPTTQILAPLATFVQSETGIPILPEFTGDSTTDILLFTADYPVRLVGKVRPITDVYFGTTQLAPAPWDVFGPSDLGIAPTNQGFNNVAVFPALVTTSGGTTPVSVQAGKVAAGYTGISPASSVFCTGFPTRLIVDDLGYNADGETAPLGYNIYVDALSQGAVIDSPIEYQTSSPAGLAPPAGWRSYSQIIISALEYTDAIREAGNLITVSVGTIALTYSVVGLWQPLSLT